MIKPALFILSLFSVVLLTMGCQVGSAERKAKVAGITANAPENQPGEQRGTLQLPLAKPKIVVKKSQRQLLLFSEGKLVRTYRVGLGLSPSGDKVRAGDRRTPEGDFYIFTKNDKSAFYLSLGVSYPNAAHAQRGLRDGLITKAEYDEIMRACGPGKPRRRVLTWAARFTFMATAPGVIGPGAVWRWRTRTFASYSQP